MDRKFLRPGWIVGHLLVVLAVLVCLRLGRWQWDRMHEGGTLQNFGYAVLWPVFGAAFIYMWFRFLQLEKLKDVEDEAELTALAAGVGVAPVPEEMGTATAPVVTGAPAGTGPAAVDPRGAATPPEAADETGNEARAATPPAVARVSRNTPSTGVTVAVATVDDENDDDPELAAYNRALAALAEKDL